MKEPLPADMTSGGRTGRAGLRLAHASSRSTHSAHEDAAHDQSLGRLATLLAAHAPYDGRFALRVPGLFVVRRSRPTRGLERATVLPALCIVAQGAKTVMLGREVYSYDASRLVVYAVDLPIAGQPEDVTQIVDSYGRWLSTSGIPKLFINGDPGGFLIGAQREFCRAWPNQEEITVKGTHFLQEDSPAEIGEVTARFVAKVLAGQLPSKAA
jgi:pimeloyl-ACP methyl ester carboxylesterase